MGIKNIIRYFIGSQTIYFILTMEIPNFNIFIRQRSEKAYFGKPTDGMQGWYILLIKIITKTIIKTGQDNQSFWKVSCK